MDVGLHHAVQGCKDHAVAFDGPAARKGLGNDCHVEVPAAGPGAFMTGMQVALIFHQQLHWGERFRQPLFYRGDARAAHGNTLLNGLTVTFA